MTEYHKINAVYKRDNKGKFLNEFACPEFEYLYDNDWIFTEKVNGTSIRLGFNYLGSRFIAGRSDDSMIPPKLLIVLEALVENIRDQVRETMEVRDICDLVLYGEGYGPKINGGGIYRSDPGFVLFDVKVGSMFLERADVEEFAAKHNIDVVPVTFRGTLRDAEYLVRGGIKSTWGDFNMEGFVGTPTVPLYTRQNKRIITKVKTCDYI